MKELLYRDHPMRWSPVEYYRDDDHFLSVLSTGVPCAIRLEPGDGTRYEFIAFMPSFRAKEMLHYGPTDRLLVVTRYIGGDPRETGILFLNRPAGPEVIDLAGANEWSQKFLLWWFQELFDRLASLPR